MHPREAIRFVLYAVAIALGICIGGFFGWLQAWVCASAATVRVVMLLNRKDS